MHLSDFADEQGRLICRGLRQRQWPACRRARRSSGELGTPLGQRISHRPHACCVTAPPIIRLRRRWSIAQDQMSLWFSSQAAVIAGFAVLTLLCLESFLGSVERVTAARVVSEPLMTVSMLLFWAGLVGVGGPHYRQPLSFPSACDHRLWRDPRISWRLARWPSGWSFCFRFFPALWLAGLVGSGLILAALVYVHLRFASSMRR